VGVTQYVSHLSDDSGLFTACGEPWQGWQEPASAPRDVGPNRGGPMPPHSQPRAHQDKVRFCGACLRVSRDQ
jgi:hypothetical protein